MHDPAPAGAVPPDPRKRNPIAAWLDELGLFGLRSHEKFVPDGVFDLPKQQIALFLRHLWATDGSVTVNKNGRGGRVYYASTSRRLVDDVARLLLRFGISAGSDGAAKAGYRRRLHARHLRARTTSGGSSQEIGVHGDARRRRERLLGDRA